ncbi:MAG: hypothetical protein MJ101_07385, partial [Clostridia bacterium]|nr:hypothetical protein [Clostridia bacterium]
EKSEKRSCKNTEKVDLQLFFCIFGIIELMKTNNTEVHHTPYQLKSAVEIEKIIEISDPVYTFGEVLSHVLVFLDF